MKKAFSRYTRMTECLL